MFPRYVYHARVPSVMALRCFLSQNGAPVIRKLEKAWCCGGLKCRDVYSTFRQKRKPQNSCSNKLGPHASSPYATRTAADTNKRQVSFPPPPPHLRKHAKATCLDYQMHTDIL